MVPGKIMISSDNHYVVVGQWKFVQIFHLGPNNGTFYK